RRTTNKTVNNGPTRGGMVYIHTLCAPLKPKHTPLKIKAQRPNAFLRSENSCTTLGSLPRNAGGTMIVTRMDTSASAWCSGGEHLGRIAPRRPPEDLAARRPGDRVHDRELDGHLVRREGAAAMRPQSIQVAAGVEDDLRARHLAQVSVRPAEHSRFLDPRELRDALLDFFREELESRHEDDGFLAALEVHGARLIARADVTRQEPAVPGDLLAQPPGHIVRREEAVASHRDLPKRPRVLAHPLVGEHGDLVAGHGKAHGGGREVPGSHVDAGQTGFDDAVGLADRHAVARFEAIDHG